MSHVYLQTYLDHTAIGENVSQNHRRVDTPSSDGLSGQLDFFTRDALELLNIFGQDDSGVLNKVIVQEYFQFFVGKSQGCLENMRWWEEKRKI